MNTITLKAHAKINPSLDVLARREDGYHEVRLIMQLIGLHDLLTIAWKEKSPCQAVSENGAAQDAPAGGVAALTIRLTCDEPMVPCDETNLAWKAAERLAARLAEEGRAPQGELSIHIEKHIPMAAGLAGGSADGAAALLACNALWEAGLSLPELLDLGARLGADVPFALMGTAYTNPALGFQDDPLAATCAIGEGTGTDLTVLPPADAHVLLAKPPIGVSTAEVYRGIDRILGFTGDSETASGESGTASGGAGTAAECDETEAPERYREALSGRPDIDLVVDALNKHDLFLACQKMGNTLELYTLRRYHEVTYTKCKIQEYVHEGIALMSGSGPTVFLLAPAFEEVRAARDALTDIDAQLILTRTVV